MMKIEEEILTTFISKDIKMKVWSKLMSFYSKSSKKSMRNAQNQALHAWGWPLYRRPTVYHVSLRPMNGDVCAANNTTTTETIQLLLDSEEKKQKGSFSHGELACPF